MYKKISDYGVIGNLCTVALVGLDGSIDWLCLPCLDSPSVFGALLDDRIGGRFVLSPTGDWDSTQEYLPDTNILVTRFRTRTGVLRLTDFMPAVPDTGLSWEPAPDLYRLVEVERGTVEIRLVFEPRFDYARAEVSVETGPCSILGQSDQEAVTLSCSREWSEILIKGAGAEARWRLGPGVNGSYPEKLVHPRKAGNRTPEPPQICCALSSQRHHGGAFTGNSVLSGCIRSVLRNPTAPAGASGG